MGAITQGKLIEIGFIKISTFRHPGETLFKIIKKDYSENLVLTIDKNNVVCMEAATSDGLTSSYASIVLNNISTIDQIINLINTLESAIITAPDKRGA